MNWALLVCWEVLTAAMEVQEKTTALYYARSLADGTGKGLLNIGCGDWREAAMLSDVNVDTTYQPVPNFVQADAHSLPMFYEGQFGCVFASHVLEHLNRPEVAFAEWQRVADHQVVCVPYWWSPHGWLSPQHKWVWMNSRLVRTWW